MKKQNNKMTAFGVFISSISLEDLKKSSQDTVKVNYVEDSSVKAKVANPHVSVPRTDLIEYLERNGFSVANIVVQKFPDDHKAICLLAGEDTVVELEKIPEVNKQYKSLKIPQPMSF